MNKLTDAQKHAIIRDRRTNGEIASEYGITPGYVSIVKYGRAPRYTGVSNRHRISEKPKQDAVLPDRFYRPVWT